MKSIRILTTMCLVALLFLQAVYAVPFTPSIERKDGPELIVGGEGDRLILTPISHLYKGVDLHEDIEESLTNAEGDLKTDDWYELVPNFPEIWDKSTGGAPLDHAVISDIFDARFESELSSGENKGKPVTFKIKIQGIGADDLFLILARPSDEEEWSVIDYTIDENGVITISDTSMSAFAVVKDNGAAPVVDPNGPQSPQTAVVTYTFATFFAFAVISLLSVVFLRRIIKKV